MARKNNHKDKKTIHNVEPNDEAANKPLQHGPKSKKKVKRYETYLRRTRSSEETESDLLATRYFFIASILSSFGVWSNSKLLGWIAVYLSSFALARRNINDSHEWKMFATCLALSITCLSSTYFLSSLPMTHSPEVLYFIERFL